jgi:hypothetical protein
MDFLLCYVFARPILLRRLIWIWWQSIVFYDYEMYANAVATSTVRNNTPTVGVRDVAAALGVRNVAAKVTVTGINNKNDSNIARNQGGKQRGGGDIISLLDDDDDRHHHCFTSCVQEERIQFQLNVEILVLGLGAMLQ